MKLQRDHAVACAHAILEIVGPLLRDEERRDAFLMFKAAAEATLRSYERQRKRRERKLPKPSNN